MTLSSKSTSKFDIQSVHLKLKHGCFNKCDVIANMFAIYSNITIVELYQYVTNLNKVVIVF